MSIPVTRGRNSEIAGIKVISNRQKIIAIINRIIPLKTTSSDVLPTRAATNRLMPRGGVIKPMARATTMIIPKWMGDSPSCRATGSRINAYLVY
ncbi:MAG: hypothetical protein PHE70_03105 [Tepidanaerobacteraceae bacterium]|nr:hypothetical protein [Tepidanaerobacteraceae bacterium]